MRPYHAREDSLPFSYGSIKSISRNGTIPDTNKNFLKSDDFGVSKTKYSQVNSEGRDTMIKQEQHLKSPQLVRKTLRSPIVNTSYDRCDANDITDFDFECNKVDKCVGINNSKVAENKLCPNQSIWQGSRTPSRNEFDELLRERREKVFTEYQYSEDMGFNKPSRSLTSLPQIKNQKKDERTHGINYDFQFYLNLDEIDGEYPLRKPYNEVINVNDTTYYRDNDVNNASAISYATKYQSFQPVTSSNLNNKQHVQPPQTLNARPETPAFPVTPKFLVPNQGMQMANKEYTKKEDNLNSQTYASESLYQTLNNDPQFKQRLLNTEPQNVEPHLVKFAKDSSKFWYKPNLSREEAISLLLDAEPGTFVVRDSTTYKNAFGIVLRVAQLPPYNASGKLDELVRHFLVEPTTQGVRLKGCANEPVFTSLSAFVYEHSINRLGLPCLLRIPECNLLPPLIEPSSAQHQLLTQGAACNVLYLFMCETESLTGEEAIRKTIRTMYDQKSALDPTEVHFKVTQLGITLTDNTRKKFFRKHYASDLISYCAVDPDYHLWSPINKVQSGNNEKQISQKNVTLTNGGKTIFAFVARRSSSSKYNQCHIFCDLDILQPASAIVSYVNRTLPTEKRNNFTI